MTDDLAEVRVLREQEIRDLITVEDAIAAARDAFVKLADGEVMLPGVLTFDMPEHESEVHAKGAHIRGTPYFAIKVAGSFPRNAGSGLPTNGGTVWIFDARTGLPDTILFDNAFLTAIRTGAAGAFATDLLAPDHVETVTIVGTGAQARWQVRALLAVRKPKRIRIWGRRAEAAEQCAAELSSGVGDAVDVEPATSLRDAVRAADIIVTTTSSREPLIEADWVQPGTHITAIGADMAGKVELEPRLLARATVVADRLEQCRTQGEIAAAIHAGAVALDDVHGELSEIVTGRKRGRADAAEITVADLTGVGVTDTVLATVVAGLARDAGIGQQLAIGLAR